MNLSRLARPGGKSLLIRHRPTTPGQRVVAVALVARSTRTTPERLKRYIALEGAPALADRYEREGARSCSVPRPIQSRTKALAQASQT